MSEWYEKALLKSVEKRINVAKEMKKIICVSPSAIKYFDIISKYFEKYPDVTVITFDQVEGIFNNTIKNGCLILVSKGLANCRKEYSHYLINKLKDYGVPVLLAMPEREFINAPPTFEGSGIHYKGIFYLVSQYAGTIRPKYGSYCEFGVYDGRTICLAYHAFKNICDKFYAFDSYSGISGALENEKTHYNDGEYYANIETVKLNMKLCGVDDKRVVIKKGKFEDILAGKTARDDGIDSISIVHIDVDVFLPAYLALKYVEPSLNDGAIILFDDFDQLAASNTKGERLALKKFLQEHDHIDVELYRAYGVFGRAFIVHKTK